MGITRQDPTGVLATRAPRVVKIVGDFSGGTGAGTGGGFFKWQNPEDSTIIVTCLVHVKTAGSAGDAVTIGVVDNGTAIGTNVGTMVITGAGTIANGMALGTGWRPMAAAGVATLNWLTGKVVSVGTGPAGTAVADVYITYWPTVYS
jgi:hypothetical protein